MPKIVDKQSIRVGYFTLNEIGLRLTESKSASPALPKAFLFLMDGPQKLMCPKLLFEAITYSKRENYTIVVSYRKLIIISCVGVFLNFYLISDF